MRVPVFWITEHETISGPLRVIVIPEPILYPHCIRAAGADTMPCKQYLYAYTGKKVMGYYLYELDDD